MEYSKTVLVFCIYTLIETRALPTTIDDTNQSQNVIKQADQETVTETEFVTVNAEILQDDFYQNIKKSSMNDSVEHKKRGRCGCRNTANGASTDKNEKMMMMKMKSGHHNGQKSNNCQHKKRGNHSGRRYQKGEAGKHGHVTYHGENKESGNEQTESSNYLTTIHHYEADNNKPQNGDKPQKEQGKPHSNKTGEKEGQKEETIPEKFKDALKNVKKQILKKN